jgi:hypothetical protein
MPGRATDSFSVTPHKNKITCFDFILRCLLHGSANGLNCNEVKERVIPGRARASLTAILKNEVKERVMPGQDQSLRWHPDKIPWKQSKDQGGPNIPAAAHLLRTWVRIPPGAWIFICCECRVLSGRGLCDELIARPEEFYRLAASLCVI